jgi:hypothetical protein
VATAATLSSSRLSLSKDVRGWLLSSDIQLIRFDTWKWHELTQIKPNIPNYWMTHAALDLLHLEF